MTAGEIATRHQVSSRDISHTASIISDRTAFDFDETKSRISEVAKNADIQFILTPAEYAAHVYFWCSYDLSGAEPGMTDGNVFDIEKNAHEVYQTIFP